MPAISAKWFAIAVLGLVASMFNYPVLAEEPVPNISGQWGRDMQFFEPPASGPKVLGAVKPFDPAAPPVNFQINPPLQWNGKAR